MQTFTKFIIENMQSDQKHIIENVQKTLCLHKKIEAKFPKQ